MRRSLTALAVLPVIALAACSQSSTSSPSASPTASSAAPASSAPGSVTVDGVTVSGPPDEEPTVTVDTAATPPAQLVVKEIYPGKGPAVGANSQVSAQYVLVPWSSGQVLQSSWSQGPLTFPLSGVIPGWQQGLKGIKQGSRVLLIIPPDLGYGANPQPGSGINPNETLVFVVDVVKVKS